MLNSYLELNFDVLHAATGNRYVDGDNIRIVNLGPSALFNNYKLSTSSGKNLEDINHAHIVSLMYELLKSSRGSDDLSIGFDRSRDTRRHELTNNKNVRGKNHVRIYLKDVIGFAEHQKTAIFGLGYNLTLTRYIDNAVMKKDNATDNAIKKINTIEWYVPHFRLSIKQQKILLNQNIKKMSTELQYPEIFVFMNEVNTQNFWCFEMRTRESIKTSIWIFVVFRQSEREHDQNLNNDARYKKPVTSAQYNIRTEKCMDNSILLNYDDDKYPQGCGLIRKSF